MRISPEKRVVLSNRTPGRVDFLRLLRPSGSFSEMLFSQVFDCPP